MMSSLTGAEFRTLRQQAGFTLPEVARAAGAPDPSCVYAWEQSGRLRQATARRALGVLDTLGRERAAAMDALLQRTTALLATIPDQPTGRHDVSSRTAIANRSRQLHLPRG